MLNERVKDIVPSKYIQFKERGYDTMAPHLQFTLDDPMIHKLVLRVLLIGGRKNLPYSDMKRFRTVLYRMVCPVFRLKAGTFEACEEVRVTRWREA